MEIRQIGDFEIDRCVDDGGYIIIDLRDREEYDYSRIKGAINVPFEDFDMYLNKNNFEGRKIILYCDRGGRSFAIARKYGDKYDIRVLGGGMHSYKGKYLIKKM